MDDGLYKIENYKNNMKCKIERVSMRRKKTRKSIEYTVGSETVAMFGGFELGRVWHLGARESRLALGGPYKVFHLGFQMVFRSYDLNQWL